MNAKPSSAAAIYCRISDDAEGEALGVARQEQDCRELADRLGLDVVAVYRDNDIGASTASRRKRRPQFETLMERAGAGEFGYLLAYSNSRLTRRPLELEDLIRLHQTTGTRIATVVSGEDDLSTADGRMVARIKANVDAAEAERTAERVARKHLANAQAGKPVGGTRPFGWQDDKRTLHPREARLVVEAVRDVAQGVGTRTIAERWNAAGVTTTTGRPWSAKTVRQYLLSPRLAGWRIHRGAVAVGPDGYPVKGQWTPILRPEEHDALVVALTRPDGRARIPRKNARHYLLTGTLRCGTCNAVMYGNAVKGPYGHTYQCKDNGHTVAVSGRSADELVRAVVLARLASEELERPAQVFEGEERLAEVEEQIAELMAAFTSKRLSGQVVFPAVAALEEERDALRADRKRAEASSGPAIARLDEQAWDELDVERQRAVVESLLDAVLVRPAGKSSGNRFDPERLEFVWRR